MKTLLLILGLFALVQTHQAQTPAVTASTVRIDLKDGSSLEVTTMRRAGNALMVPLPNGAGEVGQQIANITRIEFPEPAQIKEAESLLTAGKADEALVKIEPIVAFHAQFREIPGNFWLSSVFLKMKALLALERSKEADVLLAQIAAFPTTDTLIKDRVQMEKAAALTRAGKDDQALPIYDEMIDRSTDAETLAGAWLNKGKSLLATKKYDAAVLAFLHVPVFYNNQSHLLPAAILGSAEAFGGLDDTEQQRAALQDLIEQFPKSPEAIAADKQIKQL